MQVAPLVPEDVRATSALVRRIMLATPYYPQEVLKEEAKRFSAASLRRKDPKRVVLVAKDEGKVIGFCAGYEEEGGLFWLDWIGVDASARGKGVGRALLTGLEEHVPARIHKLWCDTRTTNEESMAMLRKHGYERVAEYRRHWFGLDFYIWEKPLKR